MQRLSKQHALGLHCAGLITRDSREPEIHNSARTPSHFPFHCGPRGKRLSRASVSQALVALLLSALVLALRVDATTSRVPPSSGGLRCPSDAQCDVLIAVHCNYADFQSRDLHRLTYMRHLPHGMDVVFLLDMPPLGDTTMEHVLKAEFEIHRDTYMLSYRATGDPHKDRGEIPYKTWKAMLWAAAQNVVSGYRYLAKCDTDSIINPYAIKHRLQSIPTTKAVYGRKLETDKGKQTFFYGGAFYLFSSDVAAAVSVDSLPARDAWELPEDQFFSRIVKDKLGDSAHHFDAGSEICCPRSMNNMWSADITNTTVAVHGVKSTESFVQVWGELLPFVRAAASAAHRAHTQTRKML